MSRAGAAVDYRFFSDAMKAGVNAEASVMAGFGLTKRTGFAAAMRAPIGSLR